MREKKSKRDEYSKCSECQDICKATHPRLECPLFKPKRVSVKEIEKTILNSAYYYDKDKNNFILNVPELAKRLAKLVGG